eukprot:TRINITY_DN5865_c0_g1_i2.p1 TRINITY_DN5865_c0_g1~~TRINITY_DN5865_c0_g1_i2.p1  ORF type:complete len:283 (+),score=25.60 TRINITY_DN5865_c0_g1_i2:119-967(+)
MALFIPSTPVVRGSKCSSHAPLQRGNARLYKNTADALFKTVTQEGAHALYKGFAVVAAFTIPAHALYFFGYEFTKERLGGPGENKGNLVYFASGVVADIFGAIVWVPQDVVKQRLQIQRTLRSPEGGVSTAKYSGSLNCMLTVIREEGFFALWTGFLPALAVYCPFVGIYFVAYEQFKLYVKSRFGYATIDDLPFWSHITGGAVAGGIAAVITAPLDVVKTRIQVGAGYDGLRHAVRVIYREEGLSAFGKGMGARLLWIAPGCAIAIAAYEQFKKMVTLLGL